MDAREQSLVEAAKKDPAHFAELYEAHFERIYAFIAGRARDRSVAEDLTAEVFRCALAAIGTFEDRGVPFAAWLFRIAANEIADHASRPARERDANPSTEPMHDAIERDRNFHLARTLRAAILRRSGRFYPLLRASGAFQNCGRPLNPVKMGIQTPLGCGRAARRRGRSKPSPASSYA